MDQQIADAAFKVAERWLYNLPSWRAEMVAIETNLEEPSGKITVSYGGIGGGGSGLEDGLFDTANGLVNDELRLAKLKGRVRVVDAAVDALGYDERMLVIMKYIEKRPVKVVCEKLIIGEDAYKRCRRRAVREIIKTLFNYYVFKDEVEKKNANRTLIAPFLPLPY